MTYRLRNIVVAVALALVAALLTSFYVTNYQRNVRSDETNVTVYVAAQDIPAGTTGAQLQRAGFLKTTEIVRRSVVPGAISNPEQLSELVAVQPVFAGEQVSTRRFATPSERGIRAQLTGTMRAVQIAGDQHQLLAGTLKAGDHVDVVASLKLSPDKDIYAARTILRDVEVLKAAAAPGGTDVGIASGQSTSSVQLALTDSQVPKMFFVTKHGDWSLQLRPPVKSADSPEALTTTPSLLADGLRGKQLEQLQLGGE